MEAQLDEHGAQVTGVPASPPPAVTAAVASIMATGSWAPDPDDRAPALPKDSAQPGNDVALPSQRPRRRERRRGPGLDVAISSLILLAPALG
jgi:hypothetical protein